MRTRQIDREEAAAQKIVRSEDEDLCDRDEAPTLSHDEAMQRVHTRAAAIYAARAERITGILVESPLRWVLLGAVIVCTGLWIRCLRDWQWPDATGLVVGVLSMTVLVSDAMRRRRRARIVARERGVR